ncbi:MAG TPA: hypothetical protein VLA04_00060, partial [Verrucomicrobiae bacterium]|nr:hypothetical protein [Verrucomicrobiae bacterium]
MPFLLVILILVGLCSGATYLGSGEDPKDARTLTVDQFYKEPVQHHGFVVLTEGQLNLLYAQLFTKDDNYTLYIPLVPLGSYQEDAKVLVKSTNEADIRLAREMLTLTADNYEEWRDKNHDKLLRAAPRVSGKLEKPGYAVSELSRERNNLIDAKVATLDTEATSTMQSSFIWGCAFLGMGTCASLLFLVYVIGPKTKLLGKWYLEDRRGIIGSEGISDEDMLKSLSSGSGKLVLYAYTFSFGIATIQYNSPPHYQTSYTASIIQSLPYSFVTLFCGWWGFPWGPVYTLSA